MNANELQKHMLGTYRSLRLCVAWIAFAFPLVLWLGGLAQGLSLQNSMSAYYHANLAGPASLDGGLMKNWFVGGLFAIGAILFIYRGFRNDENRALDFAGILAVGVAVFPMAWPEDSSEGGLSLHGACAVAFFLCIAYVCIRCSTETLEHLPDEGQKTRYRLLYRAFGIAMVGSPLIAVIVSFVLGQSSAVTFFVECAGTWVFGGYWALKSRELRLTDRDRLGLRLSAAGPSGNHSDTSGAAPSSSASA